MLMLPVTIVEKERVVLKSNAYLTHMFSDSHRRIGVFLEHSRNLGREVRKLQL